jgi:hypothetical protein
MSSNKINMRLLTNQPSMQQTNTQRPIIQRKQTLTLGFTNLKRNYLPLNVIGNKSCKSCNDKK